MNPFRIGQSLIVQFGTRQVFTVTALRTGSPDTPAACAMRFPNCTFVKWYNVADLLRWNPTYQPKPLLMLPAVCVRRHETRRVQMQQLVTGDVVWLAGYGASFAILSIGPVYDTRPFPNAPAHVVEATRDAVLVNVVTGERRVYSFRNIGHGAERVEGRAA